MICFQETKIDLICLQLKEDNTKGSKKKEYSFKKKGKMLDKNKDFTQEGQKMSGKSKIFQEGKMKELKDTTAILITVEIQKVELKLSTEKENRFP